MKNLNSQQKNEQTPLTGATLNATSACRNALSIATMCLLSSQAWAAQPATTFRENSDGIGHMLLVPYFTVQGGNATLLNITNTDAVNGKAVKLRFRGAGNGDRLFDFSLFLAPGDVWAAEVSQNPATGLARLYTPDASCTLPTQVNVDFGVDRLDTSVQGFANETREGYVEVLTMADVPPGTALFTATQHVKGMPPAPCSDGARTPAALAALGTSAGIAGAGLAAPTTGLMANWSIFNVPEATSWSGPATALQATTASGAAGAGLVVLQPQTNNAPAQSTNSMTADPLFRAGVVQPQSADFPDLSTPYVPNMDPLQQVAAISAAMAKLTVSNEFFTDDSVQAQTDWVLNFPTRRYEMAADKNGAMLYVSNISSEYFNSQSTRPLKHPFRITCLTNYERTVWDRKSQNFIIQEEITPPSMINTFRLYWMCGAVAVNSINSGDIFSESSLSASVTRNNDDIIFSDGWVNINITTPAGKGIPLIGAAFAKATSTSVSPGVSGNFGLLWPHRYTRPEN